MQTIQALRCSAGRQRGLAPAIPIPGGYNGFPLVMKSFEARPPQERTHMCRAWTVAASGLEGNTLAIRIYTVTRRLEPRHGRRPMMAARRTLAHTCAASTALVMKGRTGATG